MYMSIPKDNHDPWMNKDTPWRDRETFKRMYYDDSLTLDDIADLLGCSTWTVNSWVHRHGLKKRQANFDEWKDPDRLHALYWGDGLSSGEIAERAGCTQPTVIRWMQEFEIPRRYTEKKYGDLSTTEDGYVYYNGKNEQVWIHQLLAIANGHDPHDVFGGETNCHHKNGVPWDNRPENIELLSIADHTREHMPDLERALDESDYRIDEETCDEIRRRWRPNDNAYELAEEFDISRAAVWNHATGNCPHD